MATSNGMRQTIKRVRRAWAEVGYAQRRLFEIRTGIPVISDSRSPADPEAVNAP